MILALKTAAIIFFQHLAANVKVLKSNFFTKKKIDCLNNCKTCSDNVRCSACNGGNYVKVGASSDMCTNNCGDEFFPAANGKCESKGYSYLLEIGCLSLCKSCTINDRCIECLATFNVKTGASSDSCVSNCGDEYFPNSGKCQGRFRF